MSELRIQGKSEIESLIKEIYPYLRIKKAIARLVIEIIKEKTEVKNRSSFIEVCKKVDKLAELTDSKSRKITTEVVMSHKLETPVETRP